MLLKPYLKTLTLLCVESSSVITTIYEGIFDILFKEIIFATNAEDAILIYNDTKIDIIITAQVFQGASGMDMIQYIRDTNKDIPIVFVSSFEQVDLLTKALKLRVTSFVKKPFDTSDILDAMEDATKQLLAKKYLQEEQEKKVDALQNRVAYSDYQENLSFQKALKVIRNDFYYKQLSQDSNSITIIDFLYTAKDVISGDTYSARVIDEKKTLLFLIDGMGKGLSASISALLAVSFINRYIDEYEGIFSLKKLLSKAIKHTQKVLLDDEILSICFVLIDSDKETLEYSSFSMPPILIHDENKNISLLKSNNPPLSAYSQNFKTQTISSTNIKKLLIHSDGLVENSLKNENDTYTKYLKEDFKNSMTREDLRKNIVSKIAKQEDDITFILYNKIPLKKLIGSKTIDSKLKDVEKTDEWFDEIILKKTNNQTTQSNASLAFMELLMNAYEHGSLGIDSDKKHSLMENDEYFDFLLKKESTCNKKIKIDIYEYDNHLLVQIKDDGDGFDTTILSSIFGINKSYNHRGVFMSRNATSGIYYNNIANQISFIVKLVP